MGSNPLARRLKRATLRRQNAREEWRAAIRAAHDAGMSQTEIARHAEVSQPRISKILNE